MTTTETGRRAETAATGYLATHGFAILDRNWRTRWCEIDLIVRRDQTVYFVEVKYRARPNWGSGLDYITPAKLRQMRFAAQLWQSATGYAGQCQLLAVAVGGPDFTVERAVVIS